MLFLGVFRMCWVWVVCCVCEREPHRVSSHCSVVSSVVKEYDWEIYLQMYLSISSLPCFVCCPSTQQLTPL